MNERPNSLISTGLICIIVVEHLATISTISLLSDLVHIRMYKSLIWSNMDKQDSMNDYDCKHGLNFATFTTDIYLLILNNNDNINTY